MSREDLELLLRASRADHFGPGFSSRVMQRIGARASPRALALTGALERHFLRLAPLAAAALLVLAVQNLRGTGGGSPVAAALGLPPVTLEAAYSFQGPMPYVGP